MALRETITIRPYQPGDEQAILATFNRVHAPKAALVGGQQGVLQGFSVPTRAPAAAAGPRDVVESPIAAPRSLEQWNWRFRDNPSGTRIVLAIDEGGEVLAQVAGLPLRARLGGRNVMFCRWVDPLNARSQRTNHTRRGLFTACCEAFRDTYGGEGDGRHVFAYTSGSPATARAARAYAGWNSLGEGYVHELDVAAAPKGDYRVEVREVERFGPEATELFERVAIEHEAIVTRDAAFLNWRFADAPGRPYTLLVARERDHVVGLAVWRAAWSLDTSSRGLSGAHELVGANASRSTSDGRGVGVIAEWLVPRDEPHAASSLLAAMAERTRAAAAEVMTASFSPFSREWTEFQDFGCRVRRTGELWSGASHSRTLPTRWFARELHRTTSDSDWA